MCPFPLSVSTPDGNLLKIVKASLVEEQEKEVEMIDVVLCDGTWIFDAIAIFHSLKLGTVMPYMGSPLMMFRTTIGNVGVAARVNWVADTYPSCFSRENLERSWHCRLATEGSLKTTIHPANQKIDHYFRKSLRNPDFKKELKFPPNDIAR